MKKGLIVCVIAVVLVSFSSFVFAVDTAAPTTEDKKPCEKAKSCSTGPIQKANRGAGNLLLGWSEVPKKIINLTNECSDPVRGVLVGGYQGVCKALVRTFSGAVDLATFPIGKYDKPIIQPEATVIK